ncbi:hypothetical protein [Falsirhodobacter deserti]|uniref:hypothetical protein n=1 Tax=Falsirhodobacter deserti TaxID=1365611 RepID=UPI000FE2A78B|nr:hypothetical protein [Falsirhodobacter deserti]
METLIDYAPLISAAMTGVTALIWVVYLNVFLASYRRQHKPSILITAGGGKGMNAHCFVTNLGLEPVFILDVILDLTLDDGTVIRAIIPERNEKLTDNNDLPDDIDARGATNMGPLASAGEKDIGRFRTLIDRARAENTDVHDDMMIHCMTITVVTVTAAAAELHGASRQYVTIRDDGGEIRHLRPTEVTARQIGSFFGRRYLEKELRKELGTTKKV